MDCITILQKRMQKIPTPLHHHAVKKKKKKSKSHPRMYEQRHIQREACNNNSFLLFFQLEGILFTLCDHIIQEKCGPVGKI